MKRAVAAIALAGALLGACSAAEDEVPVSLRGRWVADSGPHQGRVFELTCRLLLLDQDSAWVQQVITEVDSTAGGTATEYVIRSSLGSGTDDELTLTRMRNDPEALVMRHVDARWLSTPDARVPWPDLTRDDCTIGRRR